MARAFTVVHVRLVYCSSTVRARLSPRLFVSRVVFHPRPPGSQRDGEVPYGRARHAEAAAGPPASNKVITGCYSGAAARVAPERARQVPA